MALKDLLHGIKANFKPSSKLVKETREVVSLRKKIAAKPNIVSYKVVSSVEPLTYKRLKDAKLLVNALALAGRDSDIIRIETTSEGFFVDERKIK